MADPKETAKILANIDARQYADVRLNTSEITDLCYLHGIITNWLAGKVETYDEARVKEAADRLAAICDRAIEVEEWHDA